MYVSHFLIRMNVDCYIYSERHEPTTKMFPWQNWCDYAGRKKLVLVGWDEKVLPPGSDCIIRGSNAINTEGWSALMKRHNYLNNPHHDHTLPEIKIEKWHEGMCHICCDRHVYLNYHVFRIPTTC